MYEQIHASKINQSPASNARVTVNSDVVDDYAKLIHEGYEFPPILVCQEGDDYHLVDGLHRLLAHIKVDKPFIKYDVFQGTLKEAVLKSLQANASHGLARTNADKRKNVQTMLDDHEWSKLSSREIAKACGVTHTFVNSMRKVETVSTPTEKTVNSSPKIEKLSKLDRVTYELKESQDAINQLSDELDSKDKLLTKQESELAILKASTPNEAQRINLELSNELEELRKTYSSFIKFQKDYDHQLTDSIIQIRKQQSYIYNLKKEIRELTQKCNLKDIEIANLRQQLGVRNDEPLPF